MTSTGTTITSSMMNDVDLLFSQIIHNKYLWDKILSFWKRIHNDHHGCGNRLKYTKAIVMSPEWMTRYNYWYLLWSRIFRVEKNIPPLQRQQLRVIGLKEWQSSISIGNRSNSNNNTPPTHILSEQCIVDLCSRCNQWNYFTDIYNEYQDSFHYIGTNRILNLLCLNHLSSNNNNNSNNNNTSRVPLQIIISILNNIHLDKEYSSGKPIIDESLMDNAAIAGRLDIVQYLSVNRTEGCTLHAIDKASGSGFIDIVRYLSENRTEGCSTNAMDNAAQYGHYQLVKYLDRYRTEGCSTYAIDMAARHGYYKIVKYLIKNRSEGFTFSALDNAALFNHFDIVKYLLENYKGENNQHNNHFNQYNNQQQRVPQQLNLTFTNALSTGNLDMVRYLHLYCERNNITPLIIPCTLEDLAVKGYLHIIKYLHLETSYIKDMVIGKSVMDEAAASGNLEMVMFLHRYRKEGCTTNAMDMACARGHLEVVTFLNDYRSEGCTQNAMDNAASNGYLSIVEYLHSHRHEGCTKNAMDFAASHGQLETIYYLHYNRHEGCTTRAIDLASNNESNYNLVKFLLENRTEGYTYNAIRNCHPSIKPLLMSHEDMCKR